MRKTAATLALIATLGACVSVPSGDSALPEPVPEASSTVPFVEGPLAAVSTSGGPSGNRYHEGSGSLPGAPLELVTDGRVQWVVAAEVDGRLVVVSVDEDGGVTAHTINGDSVEATDLNLASLPAGTPPALVVNIGVLVLGPPLGTGSTLTNPLALSSGGLAFVSNDGAVVVTQLTGNRRLEIDPLPDARLALSSVGVMAVLTQPTDRYPHAIAGDALEASSIGLVDLTTLEAVDAVVPDGRVAEGSGPMWADLDGDGTEEMVVTVSDADSGARLAVVTAGGEYVAESDPIGLGNRWRHQIAVAPFGPNGEIELVDIRTPHIGGTVEFFAWEEDRLGLTASLGGYSSHTIGSRNLDQGLAADANGDGRTEVVVPHQSMTSLAGVQRTDTGAEEVWSVDLGGELSSNLAGVTTADGRFVLVAGLSDGRVLVWP